MARHLAGLFIFVKDGTIQAKFDVSGESAIKEIQKFLEEE